MLSIFSDVVENTIEVLWMNSSLLVTLQSCLVHLGKVLEHYIKTNLMLNLEKCHFMVKESIVIGHKILGWGIHVDQANVKVIAKFPPLSLQKILEVSSSMPILYILNQRFLKYHASSV